MLLTEAADLDFFFFSSSFLFSFVSFITLLVCLVVDTIYASHSGLVPLFNNSGAISLVWMTRGFYPCIEGFST